MSADDDDEMADLFSFGSSDISGGEEAPTGAGIGALNTMTTSTDRTALSPLSADENTSDILRKYSSDSFTELMDEGPSLFGSSLSTPQSSTRHDAETQEMLDWLDEDPREKQTSPSVEFDGQDTVVFVSGDEKREGSASTTDTAEPNPPSAETQAAAPTVVELPPQFDTLNDALPSTNATVSQIRTLAQRTSLKELDDPSIRPELYCRLICGGKTKEQTQTGSLADSFLSWVQEHKDDLDNDDTAWIEEAANFCMKTILTETNNPNAVSQQDLIQLLRYNNTRSAPSSGNKRSMDTLVPCVASTLLASGIPLAATSVCLGQIQADYMPLTALQEEERWEAALSLHQHLYLLACYHLPLLVVHLDRYLPGWHGPRVYEGDEQTQGNVTERARNLDKQGQIPSSWLLSFLSGQVLGKNLPIDQVLRLWDAQFAQRVDSAQSLRFFLTLAVLERAADHLILATGEKLVQQFQEAFLFPDKGDPWFEEWMPAAQDLYKATPVTVLKKLQTAEDEAVQLALLARQARAEAALQERLKAEAAAHKEEQERKAEEARQRLTRARLVAFYRKHAPEKEDNIDRILTNYADRLEVLEAKLYKKYGENFEPAIKPKEITKKPPPHKRSQSGGILRSFGPRKGVEAVSLTVDEPVNRKPDQVSVLVTPSEVLPIVCWAKGGSPRTANDSSTNPPLKYFLVDSRSEEAAAEQGRFPTAVTMSPESMLEPEKVQSQEEMFEALRGAVHIVVMGEGFSAVPNLYKQKLSPTLEAAMVQDESTTNICALFFIKKGFPFVSVLEGGFASAHSWLIREGPNNNLRASSVLVDYDPEASVFGQMETLHNASATEKAQRQLTNLVEKSLVSMTLQAQKLEKLAADMEANKKSGNAMGGLRLGSLFRGSSQSNVHRSDVAGPSPGQNQVVELKLEDGTPAEDVNASANSGSSAPSPGAQLRKSFRNPFAGRADDDKTTLVRTKSNDSLGRINEESPPSSPQGTNPPNENPPESSGSNNTAAPPAGGINILKRNPFARFGNNASLNTIPDKPQPLPQHSRTKSGGVGAFAGLNNLRKSTLGRIRSVPVGKSSRQLKDEDEEISFD